MATGSNTQTGEIWQLPASFFYKTVSRNNLNVVFFYVIRLGNVAALVITTWW